MSPSDSITVTTWFFTSISENSPSVSFANASVFLLSACAAFLFRRFLHCVDSLLCPRLQLFLDFFNGLWCFFRAQASHPSVFSVSSILSRLFVSSLSFLWTSFFGVVIVNVAITHLWSLPMSIMSLASASLLYFRCFLSIMMLSIASHLLSGICSSFVSHGSFCTSC